MRSLLIYTVIVLLELSSISYSLTIPPRNIGAPMEGTSPTHVHYDDIDTYRVLLVTREKIPPKQSQPKAQPGNPIGKPKPAPKASSKPAPAPGKSTGKAPLVQPTPSTPSTKPSSPLKLLPFTKEPRPTKAVDICDLPGVDCDESNEGVSDAVARRDQRVVHNHAVDIQKRSSPRTYSVVPGGGTPTMMMTSLPYPLESKLFPAGSSKVILDFETDDVRDAKFKMFSTPPKRADPSTYIVEHIVELQSIKLFLNAAIRVPKIKGVTQLSQHVDLGFFTKHWGTSDAQVQQKIANRPNPFPGYDKSAARSSLNDLIFEALGSKTNTADFVLCEEGVNAMKAKLWSHINPFDFKDWQDIAKDAADGSIPRNRHLAVLRSVLGVYNYMNSPDVTKRLQESIKNVKMEFSNFKAITGEDVKDTSGNSIDLPALWVEFMTDQLDTFTKSGTKYLEKQIQFALPLYQAHLKELQQASKRLSDEEARKSTPQGKAAIDQRILAHNNLVQALPAKLTTLSQSEIRLESAKKAYEAAAAAAKNLTPATRTQLLADKRAKSNAKRAAVAAHYNALVAKGKQDRDIIKLRPADLAALIKDLEADIKQMTDYRAAALAMKAPKAE